MQVDRSPLGLAVAASLTAALTLAGSAVQAAEPMLVAHPLVLAPHSRILKPTTSRSTLIPRPNLGGAAPRDVRAAPNYRAQWSGVGNFSNVLSPSSWSVTVTPGALGAQHVLGGITVSGATGGAASAGQFPPGAPSAAFNPGGGVIVSGWPAASMAMVDVTGLTAGAVYVFGCDWELNSGDAAFTLSVNDTSSSVSAAPAGQESADSIAFIAPSSGFAEMMLTPVKISSTGWTWYSCTVSTAS